MIDLTPESNEIVIKIKCDFPEKLQKETCNQKKELDNNLMTVPDLCKYLKCQPSFIYRLTHEHKIPFIKLGDRTLRFDPKQIKEWLANTIV